MNKNNLNSNTAVATVEQNESGLIIVDLNSGNLPALSDAVEVPFDLTSDYWTPEMQGESKRVFFDKIAVTVVLDQQSGAPIDLECAFFIEETPTGYKTIANGSKRLVGALEAHKIQKGTPLQITYLGKKKNRTNSFMSDSWSIKPLRIAI